MSKMRQTMSRGRGRVSGRGGRTSAPPATAIAERPHLPTTEQMPVPITSQPPLPAPEHPPLPSTDQPPLPRDVQPLLPPTVHVAEAAPPLPPAFPQNAAPARAYTLRLGPPGFSAGVSEGMPVETGPPGFSQVAPDKPAKAPPGLGGRGPASLPVHSDGAAPLGEKASNISEASRSTAQELMSAKDAAEEARLYNVEMRPLRRQRSGSKLAEVRQDPIAHDAKLGREAVEQALSTELLLDMQTKTRPADQRQVGTDQSSAVPDTVTEGDTGETFPGQPKAFPGDGVPSSGGLAIPRASQSAVPFEGPSKQATGKSNAGTHVAKTPSAELAKDPQRPDGDAAECAREDSDSDDSLILSELRPPSPITKGLIPAWPAQTAEAPSMSASLSASGATAVPTSTPPPVQVASRVASTAPVRAPPQVPTTKPSSYSWKLSAAAAGAAAPVQKAVAPAQKAAAKENASIVASAAAASQRPGQRSYTWHAQPLKAQPAQGAEAGRRREA